MININFGDNLGLETHYKEYKVFNFFPKGVELSNEEAYDLIQNKRWIFNSTSLDNLLSMITIYLPKYMCAYLSTKMDISSKLIFGVDDIGNVIGIPYQNDLDINIIKKHIINIINTNILSDDECKKLLKVKLIEIKTNFNNTNIKETNPELLKFIEINNEYKTLKNKYIKKRLVWEKLALRYNDKICNLVNNKDTRLELIEYIFINDYFNPILKLLRTNWILKPFATEDLIKNKNNKKSIYYWVTQWKDKMLMFVKSIKPRFFFKYPTYLYPLSILLSLKSMLPYWFTHNTNMKLYLLVIEFLPHNSYVIKYKNIYNEWSTCIRTINDSGPCCQHLY
jgi:hypothetical protein